jgi:uncharacterized caspase-like protein
MPKTSAIRFFLLTGALILIMGIAAIFGATPAGAERSERLAGKRWAVIVGVTEYRNGIRPLSHAVKDARLIYQTLTDPAVGGCPAENVILLTSDQSAADRKPTRANIEKAMQEIAGKTRPEDTFWFFFSGHGKPGLEGRSYLLPEDARPGDLANSAVSTRLLREVMHKESAARRKIVILDACHSGSAKSGIVERVSQKPEKREEEISAGSVVVLASSQLDEPSYEYPDIGHGVFTYYLAQGLMGAAVGPSEKTVSVSQLQSYLRASVAKRVQEMGDKQTPVLLPNPLPPQSDFVLASRSDKAVEQLPKPTAARLKATEPLGPALVVMLEETRMLPDGKPGPPSEIAETEIKSALMQKSFPIVDRQSARRFQELLGKENDPRAAADQAQKVGARFLLRGRASTSSTALQVNTDFIKGELIVVKATITVELIDEAGNVLDTRTFAPEGQKDIFRDAVEGEAARKALTRMAGKVVEAFLPKIQEALKMPVEQAKRSNL